MLKNKKVKMALSLIIAIAIWIYVVGLMDPVSKTYYAEVPIKMINVEQLEARGLAVSSSNIDSVSVSLTGQKSQLAEIDARDISATIDVSDLEIGENTCKIVVKSPEKSEVYDQSVMRAVVNVEEMTYADKHINVIFPEGSYHDAEPAVVEKSQQVVTVYGAKSLVAKVDHVNAVIDEDSDLGEKEETYEAKLIPVNKNDKRVSNVSTSSEKIKVVAALLTTKTVPLNVEIEGLTVGGIERDISYPKEIIIKGHKKVVDNVNEINATPINVATIYDDTNVKINVVLPEGISLADNNPPLEVLVTVGQEGTRSFSIATSRIHVNTDKTYDIEEQSIKITVVGDKDILKKMKEDSFNLSVDIDDDTVGVIAAQIKCKVNEKLGSIKIKPEKIHITIEE